MNISTNMLSMKLVGEFGKKNEMDSDIEIELQTNTIVIENEFWFYFLIVINNENQEVALSEPFTLISYKQLMKRKKKSFLQKQKIYMLNREGCIFPYYFESMFYCSSEDGEDGEDNQYKLKNTFTFGIKFFKERRIVNNSNINNVSNFVVDKKEESAELAEEK
ncbi:hypothetical protein LY90DRAFT_621920 [Neocallimastix californiae]|uniref:Uncharacterized protein n=1 Tax=Neocallimastix californiae TaxID=1754190 RepID=A0A1Y2C5U8_9FUNG|nr:hypothetical protein LY90DRAFT_621920 [Neocallimastix californiae]|eukprot:ORY42422.1 hypothetical protein LY90DRAFT_621920 [Neocallimastix californiae]